MAFCHECGASTSEDAKFCRECGQALTLVDSQIDADVGTVLAEAISEDWAQWRSILSRIADEISVFSYAIEEKQGRGVLSLFIGKGYGSPCINLINALDGELELITQLGSTTVDDGLRDNCVIMIDVVEQIAENANYARSYCDIPAYSSAVHDAMIDIVNTGRQIHIQVQGME